MTGWTTLLEGLSFPEGPRWREGELWLSDFYTHRVLAVGLDGAARTAAEVPGQPSGLGWLPDGRLLVVSMTDRRLLRLDPGGLAVHAELSGVAAFHCNDMVVDGAGRAYVGNFGFNHYAGEPPVPARLARVDPDGAVTAEPGELMFPNGAVITADARTLIVAETRGGRLSAFAVASDGALSGQRTWADLGADAYPDGICLDAEGAVWYADPRANEVVRVRAGGEILERRSTGPDGAYACMLGGPERRTLFVCVNRVSGPAAAERRDGRVVLAEVPVPGAGWPGNPPASSPR